MLPRSQVSPKLVEMFKAEERAKRKEFLHKFVDTCSAAQVDQITFCAFRSLDFMNKILKYNFTMFLQVNVEVVMIESDMVAKAILDLISVLQIKKLVLGSTKVRSLSL